MGNTPSCSSSQPVYNKENCKAFINPEINQENCKAFISSPRIGINYSPVNDESKMIIEQLQKVMSQLQPMACGALGQNLIDSINDVQISFETSSQSH